MRFRVPHVSAAATGSPTQVLNIFIYVSRDLHKHTGEKIFLGRNLFPDFSNIFQLTSSSYSIMQHIYSPIFIQIKLRPSKLYMLDF